MKGRIKKGTLISHDFSSYKWPSCAKPKTMKEVNHLMVFDVEWVDSRWVCRAKGFGGNKNGAGEYGNGAIFVTDKNAIELSQYNEKEVDNIKVFPSSKIDPSIILDKAKAWGLSEVIIIGLNDMGEILMGGSEDDLKDVLWLMYKAQKHLDDQIEG